MKPPDTRLRLVVGTGGFAVWSSDDLGQSWFRPYAEHGIYPEARVWSLASDAREPTRIYAGTDLGIHVWRDAEKRWEHLASQLDRQPVWSLVQSPQDADTFFAGTQYPAALYRSTDGARSWERLPVRFAERCMYVGWPRVTQILLDPTDPDVIFAGVEIDGVYRSDDAGRNWKKVVAGMVSEDIHCLTWVARGARRLLFATTNKGIHRSEDRGESWEHLPFDSPWPYTRTLMQAADGSDLLFLCNGNGPPGSAGCLRRSRDGGRRWEDAGLPDTLNSTPWCIATHRAAPEVVFVCSNLGQVYRSMDRGDTWTKLPREFGEIRSALCVPLETEGKEVSA